MNLLCNIIKSEEVEILGKRKIKVNSNKSNFGIESDEFDMKRENEMSQIKEEIELKLNEAKEQGDQIIQDAQTEGQKIIEQSKEEVCNIEKRAYEEGHKQGLKNGYEDGYKEVYEEYVEKAKEQANKIIENANNILIQANNEISNYMKENRNNILNISISIAEQVLKEKFEDISAMDNLIGNVIEEYELKENFVIKVNPTYKESLDKQVLALKESYKISGDVFVLGDESIEAGNAIIDNVNGSLIVGIDGVVGKIKEELL
ncbi:hypothetical protein TEMA_40850 [Terrisporobacter mayombei]|uniref:Flagellar assembly protein FliH/Type III secretion system HrpE domain-containing protein n=2 Tax=Terrisporobacter mayombei TaxID=1541 RepID=A0ABY9Q7M1_9FIRM|nr:hypothetical protein TEMA_40850 [Terrisporobacter mayombei]